MSQNFFANNINSSGDHIKNKQLIRGGGYSGISAHAQHALARRTPPSEAQLVGDISGMKLISGVDIPIDTSCCMASSFKDNVATAKNTYKIRTIMVGSLKKYIVYIDQGTNCCK